MPGQIQNWTGEEWQGHCLRLLKLRYNSGFFEVPDEHQGDCGLEGFATDGNAYQCYAAQEPLTAKDRYEKQRDKITDDIKKFIENKDMIALLLGAVKICCWALLVPRYADKRLLAHAHKKAQEVIQANLPYVAAGFSVNILNEETFAVERARLLDVGLSKINLSVALPENSAVDEWVSKHDSLVQKLDTKLSKVKKEYSILRMTLLRRYVAGQDALDELRKLSPQLYARAIRAKREQESFLETECELSEGKPMDLLRDTLGAFENHVQSEVPSLAGSAAKTLAYEAVTDWLLRCPLDFS
jgi:hypothetical protein